MKRLFTVSLCVLLALTLTACGLFPEAEPSVGFIDVSVLDAFRLSDIPVPEGELRCSGNKVYCNMSETDLEDYCAEVMAYLLAKEDIYHKGYHYETGFAGGIFYIPEYRFAPLKESTDPTVGWFIFSLTEELNGGDEYNYSYWDGVFVRIQRQSGIRSSFEYDTVIEIDESVLSVTCIERHSEHTYEYEGNDYCHQKIYTCGCPTPDIAESHVDVDEDNYCDLCAVLHKHTYTEWYRNATHHWRVCDCLWNVCHNSIYAEHVDLDGDGICDDCAYSELGYSGEEERE